MDIELYRKLDSLLAEQGDNLTSILDTLVDVCESRAVERFRDKVSVSKWVSDAKAISDIIDNIHN